MLITVAMPVYNGARFVGQAIQGVLNQSFKNFELLIIDDASADKTLDVVKSFSDSRIRILINQKNIGGYKNFNKCLSLATGKYVFINHQDDIMMSNLLQTTVNICESNENISACGVNAIRIDEYGTEYGPFFTYTDQDIIFTQESFLDTYFSQYSMAISSVLLRNDVIRKNRLTFNKKDGNSADMSFWIRLALCSSNLYFVHTPLFYRRVHEAQWSTSFFKTEEGIEDQILHTDINIILCLSASSLPIEKKITYINKKLAYSHSLLLRLSAHKRDQLNQRLRKKLIQPLKAAGIEMSQPDLKVYSS